MIAPGTVIDSRYRVFSKLGSGGMADVYLAEDELLGRRVAVKVLQERFAGDLEFVERFRREASAAAALSHPNVVAIFDRGSWEGTYYIAMEYVPGKTLKELIREDGPLPPSRALEVAIQVLRAASFAHRHGVIHRDLKPHNIIVGEEGRVTVTDFGIAHAIGGSDMTHTGSIMGTAQYLSPEQAQGGEVSEASDIYAVGILLYELLTGTVPFEGESPVAVALQHLSAAAPPPSQRNPSLGPELDRVVLRALAKEPTARYHSADQFIAALEEVRSHLHSGPTPVGPGAEQQPTVALAAPTTAWDGRPAQSGSSRRLWLAALAALLIAGGTAAGLILATASAPVVAVPSLIGQSQAAAVQTLHSVGLVALAVPASSSAPPGTVIAQRPAPGTRVSRGSAVYITVSTGGGTALIPKVAGLAEEAAIKALKAAGFNPLPSFQPSKTVPAGKVIGTNPPEAVEAARGDTVLLYVSSGPSPAAPKTAPAVRVPSVVGLSEAAAREALAAAGLKATVSERRESTAVSQGTVLAQSPPAGATTAEGSPVSLVVASGPNRLVVPDVVGKNEATAAAELGAAGFQVASRTVRVSEPEEAGLVVEEIPPAGRRAKRGTTVTIVVGSATETRTSTTATTPAGEGTRP